MSEPLVTISIPTYNSEPFLANCINAIKAQTYKNIDINIIDGNSKDKTIEIGRSYGIEPIIYPGALLGARDIGLKAAKGEYILLLDSDQILAPDAVERAVNAIQSQGLDMLIFEEDVYKQDTFLEKLFHYDRVLIHSVKDFSPFTGVMLPRFYKKDLLLKAFANIAPEILESVGGQDHAIIYLEMWNLSHKVNLLPSAVRHIEPSSMKVLVKKFYRWGYTSIGARSNKYTEMLGKKERFRKGLFSNGLVKESLGSVLLLVLKGVPYKYGYYAARIKASRNTKLIVELPNIDTKTLPFVSYVLPTYNAEKYLRRCLDSIFAQDYPKNRYEVIVADGESTDDTLKILKKYKVSVLYNRNRNSDDGKYLALKEAKGEVVAFIDSDNIIADKNWLFHMVLPLIENPDIDFVESNYLINTDFTSINKYVSLLVIADPLARMLANRPQILVKDKYILKYYKKGAAIVAGANGFVWRNNRVLPYLNHETQKFAETNLLSELAQTSELVIANIPNVGIYHYYCESLPEYIQKRFKIAQKHLMRKEIGQITWVDRRGSLMLILSSLYLVTIVGPIIEALYCSIRDKRISWLWHPIISFLTIVTYVRVSSPSVSNADKVYAK